MSRFMPDRLTKVNSFMIESSLSTQEIITGGEAKYKKLLQYATKTLKSLPSDLWFSIVLILCMLSQQFQLYYY